MYVSTHPQDVPQDCGKAPRTNNVTCDPAVSWQCIPRLAPPGQVATENYINWWAGFRV